MYGYLFVEISACILVGGDKCMDYGCVEVSVWILVVFRLLYVYWLCLGYCLYIGCVEVIVWILVVFRLVYLYWLR